MRRNLILSVLLTTLVCVGAFVATFAAGWKPLLGLDLRGGLSVVYCQAAKGTATTKCAPGTTSKAKLDTVVGILQNRANAYGVSQPNINVQGNDVVVQIPGAKDARQVLSQLGQTAQLYFRPVLCIAPPYSKPGPTTTTTSTTTTKPSGTSTPTTAAGAASTSTPTTTSTASSTTTTTLAGKGTGTGHSAPYVYPPSSACPSSFRPSVNNRAPSGPTSLSAFQTTPATLDDPHKSVILNLQGSTGRYLLGPSQASGTIIQSANVTYQAGQGYVVNFQLTKTGTPIWDHIADVNYGYLLADDLGGSIVSAPAIEAKGSQFGNQGQVSGGFTQAQANGLAINLNYGALPIPMAVVTSQVVSPTLGASSLHAGLLAGLLGLLLVMLYTIFYYRALGIVVVLGLVTTAGLLYGIISALGHSGMQLTLDLSGITGLIVSVGITVDSYVVYFERLKDEVRAGRSIRASVDRGFKSAYRTIISADAVSFIGALVLWWLSVGAVRGFAFMLGLSTLIDILTAYLFTRPLVILLGRNRLFTEARGLGVARGLGAERQETSS
jgi:preprotein translocase subunit SecD